jgi:hypothetical protein
LFCNVTFHSRENCRSRLQKHAPRADVSRLPPTRRACLCLVGPGTRRPTMTKWFCSANNFSKHFFYWCLNSKEIPRPAFHLDGEGCGRLARSNDNGVYLAVSAYLPLHSCTLRVVPLCCSCLLGRSLSTDTFPWPRLIFIKFALSFDFVAILWITWLCFLGFVCSALAPPTYMFLRTITTVFTNSWRRATTTTGYPACVAMCVCAWPFFWHGPPREDAPRKGTQW